MYHGDSESIKVVDFDGLFLTAIFYSKRDFLAETNYTRKILHLLEIR